MKSKNIPQDIRIKSIKEAQSEIEEIIIQLEDTEANHENFIDKYNRMMQLNHHIQDEFKKKSNQIKKLVIKKGEKLSPKNLK